MCNNQNKLLKTCFLSPSSNKKKICDFWQQINIRGLPKRLNRFKFEFDYKMPKIVNVQDGLLANQNKKYKF